MTVAWGSGLSGGCQAAEGLPLGPRQRAMENRLLELCWAEGRARLGAAERRLASAPGASPCPPTAFLVGLLSHWDRAGYQLGNLLSSYQPPCHILETVFTFEPHSLKVRSTDLQTTLISSALGSTL